MEESNKKESSAEKWFYFLLFCALSFTGFYYNVWQGFAGVMFGLAALFSFPNTKLNSWLQRKVTQSLEIGKNLLYLGIFLLIIVGVIWFVSKVFTGIGNLGTYEGRNAEEWFNEYDYSVANNDELRDCVETASNYYGYEDYEDLQYQLDDVADCL